MSRDKSLKSADTLVRHRNVLTRAERIERLKELGQWDEGRSPAGLPKVAHRKVAVGKKAKAKKGPEGEGDAAGAAAPAEGDKAAKPAAKSGGKKE